MTPMTSVDRTGAQQPLRVALLGCGVVGSQVARLITQQGDDLKARTGRTIELVGIGVRDITKPREGIDRALLTDDVHALVTRGDLDVVIEVIGGIEPARSLLLAAIDHGASIVTANKVLLAEDGETIFTAAERAGVDVYFEAAVAGAIPIVRPLRESLVGDEILAVMGIVNGTTNFILDKMVTEGAEFADVLAEAQRLGFAEADPTADVEGFDAAAKAAIIATLAFHTRVRGADVYREGITGITSSDIAVARELGCVVKLLAIARLTDDGRVSVRVHPAMIPERHPLASVPGAFNAVFVESREAGQLMFLGPGAGGAPTASAVMGDLVAVARNRVRGVAAYGQSLYADRGVAPIGEARATYLLRLQVSDQPGVLAAVATVLAEHNVSVQTVKQTVERRDDPLDVHEEADVPHPSAWLSLMTHTTREADLRACLADLSKREFVLGPVRMMRGEGF